MLIQSNVNDFSPYTFLTQVSKKNCGRKFSPFCASIQWMVACVENVHFSSLIFSHSIFSSSTETASSQLILLLLILQCTALFSFVEVEKYFLLWLQLFNKKTWYIWVLSPMQAWNYARLRKMGNDRLSSHL